MKISEKILIIGAGPTGLTLANSLAVQGIPFVIVDKRPGPSYESKGLALNVASQYGLSLIGVDEVKSANGVRISRAEIYWNGERYSSINFEYLKGPIQSLITQPQRDTEMLLIEALKKKGHNIFWSVEVMSIDNRPEFADVTFKARADIALPELPIRYRYVIGCDGKNSIARSVLATEFEGEDYNMHFVLGDFPVNEIFSGLTTAQYYIYDDTFFIFVPIGEGIWRVVLKYTGNVPSTAICREDLPSFVNQRLGFSAIVGPAIWISRAPFYVRISKKLQEHSVFLAGDAAHLYSPIGGTGMNTGIQDALNLGWKIGLAYQGIANPTLLDSYMEERLPVIRENASATDVSTKIISMQLPDHPLIARLAPKMPNRAFMRKVIPQLHSGLNTKLVPVKSSGLEDFYNEESGALHLGFLVAAREIALTLKVSLYGKVPLLVHLRNTDLVDQAVIIQLRNSISFSNMVIVVFVLPDSDMLLPAIDIKDNEIKLTSSQHYLWDKRLQGQVEIVRPDGVFLCRLGFANLSVLPRLIKGCFHFEDRDQNQIESF